MTRQDTHSASMYPGDPLEARLPSRRRTGRDLKGEADMVADAAKLIDKAVAEWSTQAGLTPAQWFQRWQPKVEFKQELDDDGFRTRCVVSAVPIPLMVGGVAPESKG